MTTKKTKPEATKGPSKKTKKTKEKVNAVAFANWELPLKAGKGTVKCSKGFPIFDNEKYPNPKEAWLVDLAKRQGGSVTLKMNVTITLNEQTEMPADTDIDIVK